MQCIVYKSMWKMQLRAVYHPSKHMYCLQHIGYARPHFHQHFCTESSKKVRTKLKSKVPEHATTVAAAPMENVSKFAQMAEEARKFEENYRWVSPRAWVIGIVVYLAVSFSCFGYMWYHRLYASRLMYVQPFLLNINPERAHKIAIKVHQWPRIVRRIFGMINNPGRDSGTKQKIWGLTFLNPIGLAAGFDKHAECIDGVLDLGFGFVEVGTVTPNEQKGNPKPRVWRLKKDLGAIHNYGDNSVGHDCVRARLLLRIENMDTSVGLVGVNLGTNHNTPETEARKDYILGIKNFVDIADYLVLNLHLPKPQGRREVMEDLLAELMKTRDKYHEERWQTSIHSDVKQTKPPAPPLLIKIGLDLTDEELEDVAHVAMAAKIDGIIIANSTHQRSDELQLKSKKKWLDKEGGLSGKPIFHKSNEVLRKMYGLTSGEIPLIGSGGVSSAREAYAKIKCGASLVQLYTAYTYNGPFLIRRMIRELGQYAELDGYDKIEQAIGCDVRKQLGMDPLTQQLSFEEEELMSDLEPIPQRSFAARAYGVIDTNFKK
eukprot:257552_1